MDIGSGKGYPSSSLSNFAPHEFVIDGITCQSMEGFLQSLKFQDKEMQKHICTLVGKKAKFKGSKKNWKKNTNFILARHGIKARFKRISRTFR